MTEPRDLDYAALLAFRTELRRFQRWSEQQAQEAGLTHAQHQLLLAVRGHPDTRGPTVGQVAEYLLLTPSATVELLDRVEEGGFVRRTRDVTDRRMVRLQLTSLGERRLAALTRVILPVVRDLPPLLWQLTQDLTGSRPPAPRSASGEQPAPHQARSPVPAADEGPAVG